MILENKNIYFRFDAGGLIGFGHHGRMEAIAEACEDLNLSPVYIVRKRPSLKFIDFKYPVIWLEECPDVLTPNYQSWIYENEEKEAEELMRKIPQEAFVFVDHYGLGEKFFQCLRIITKVKTGTIYDFHKNVACENLVVNYNAGAESLSDFYKKKSPNTHFLLGTDYALVKREIRQARTVVKKVVSIQKVAVYLGGVGLQLLKKAMELGLDSGFFSGKEIKWLINCESDLRVMRELYPKENVEFLPRMQSLISLYGWADVAIGACGVSFIERSVLGIPQLLFKVADNQKEIAEYLKTAELVCYMGDLENADNSETLTRFKQLSISKLVDSTKKSFERIDGEGSLRVGRVISQEFFTCG